jgi:PAS domain-containing protein
LGKDILLLEALFASIREAAIITDPEDRILKMNPAAEALTLWSEPDAAGEELNVVLRLDPDEFQSNHGAPGRRVQTDKLGTKRVVD